jgi:hypothetical protein
MFFYKIKISYVDQTNNRHICMIKWSTDKNKLDEKQIKRSLGIIQYISHTVQEVNYCTNCNKNSRPKHEYHYLCKPCYKKIKLHILRCHTCNAFKEKCDCDEKYTADCVNVKCADYNKWQSKCSDCWMKMNKQKDDVRRCSGCRNFKNICNYCDKKYIADCVNAKCFYYNKSESKCSDCWIKKQVLTLNGITDECIYNGLYKYVCTEQTINNMIQLMK